MKIKHLKKSMQNPVGVWCGYQEKTTQSHSIIQYERLTISASNLGTGLDAGSGNDLILVVAASTFHNPGIFTSPKSGVWLVSFSLVSAVSHLGDNWVWVYVNKKILGGTENRVKSASLNQGGEEYIVSSGGRTLFLSLNKGDTVSLKTGVVSDSVWHVNTCFHFVSTML